MYLLTLAADCRYSTPFACIVLYEASIIGTYAGPFDFDTNLFPRAPAGASIALDALGNRISRLCFCLEKLGLAH